MVRMLITTLCFLSHKCAQDVGLGPTEAGGDGASRRWPLHRDGESLRREQSYGVPVLTQVVRKQGGRSGCAPGSGHRLFKSWKWSQAVYSITKVFSATGLCWQLSPLPEHTQGWHGPSQSSLQQYLCALKADLSLHCGMNREVNMRDWVASL